jgi:hypothetical protein
MRPQIKISQPNMQLISHNIYLSAFRYLKINETLQKMFDCSYYRGNKYNMVAEYPPICTKGRGQRTGDKGVKNVYILHHFAPKKTPNFFSPATGCLKNVYQRVSLQIPLLFFLRREAPKHFLVRKSLIKIFAPDTPFFSRKNRTRRVVSEVIPSDMAICPPKKLKLFFACGGLSQKCVYGHLARSKVLDRVFFIAQKKAIFHLYLIVCPILIGPLSNPLLSAAFL